MQSGFFICPLLKTSLQCCQIKNPGAIAPGFCAQDWIRTSTPFRALPPQSSASTNFATWATLALLRNSYGAAMRDANIHGLFFQNNSECGSFSGF